MCIRDRHTSMTANIGRVVKGLGPAPAMNEMFRLCLSKDNLSGTVDISYQNGIINKRRKRVPKPALSLCLPPVSYTHLLWL